MGDSRRFNEFAKLIEKQFNKKSSIADVAGGKGYMREALYERGFCKTETWDKRTVRLKNGHGKQRFEYFEWNKAPSYDGVIGMHPDEATDHIIKYCGLHRVKGLICPCCVKASAEVYWGRNKYKDWANHLEKLANSSNLEFYWFKMPFNGRNDAMLLMP